MPALLGSRLSFCTVLDASLANRAEEVPRESAIEVDDLGLSLGVEREEIESPEGSHPAEPFPFDPKKIDVVTEVRSLDNVLKRLKARQIDLDPDFQRSRGIWTPRKKSLLIESLLLRIPLPTFYVAELHEGANLGEDAWAVVDGIQRLSTIAEFVTPDVLGSSPLRLGGLEYLETADGHTFDELPLPLQLRVEESQFTFQVIRRSTPENVKLNIFARINTGGESLTAQELRHALIPGPARAFLKQLAESEAFREGVDNSVRPKRMADREMVLRFLAFRVEDPLSYTQQDFDQFLRASMQTCNGWDEPAREHARSEFEQAMRVCRELFDNDAFRKRYHDRDSRRPISKALFEAVAVAVATVAAEQGSDGIARLIRRREDVRSGFRKLMEDATFERAISQGTGDPVRVRQRFGRLIVLMQDCSA